MNDHSQLILWHTSHIADHMCGDLPVTDGFPAQRAIMQSFDGFFAVGLDF